EEIGSPNLSSFLATKRSVLTADCAIVSDMQIPSSDHPAITYALRGGLSAELEARGPERELHSGVFGGAVHNPLQALCEIIARLHDGRGRITIPVRVRHWDAQERAYMRQVGPSDATISGVAEERCELGPGGRRAHIDNPDRLDPRPWRLCHDEVRDFARLDAAPEFLFRRHQNGEIERVHRNGDLDPFAAAGNDGEHRGPQMGHPHVVLDLRHVLFGGG